MQEEVNKIIFNALADGREIWFPGVGSLVPEFRSAWRASARQLERPSRRIAFLLSEQRGISVIDLIAQAGACDVAAAEDIYSRWLDKVRVDDGVSIPGVGTLNHRYFRLDPQLDAVLNPLGHVPLSLKRRRSRMPLYLGVALLCTAAVGYGIWQYGEWMRVPFGSDSEKQTIELAAETIAPASADVEDQITESEVIAGEAQPTESTPSAENKTGESVVAETSSNTDIAPKPLGSDSQTQDVLSEVARMSPGRTYVVWGVYSTEANARRAIAEARGRLPQIAFRIYYFGEKWMVSVFESDSAEECRTYMNNAGSGLQGLWPYTKKR